MRDNFNNNIRFVVAGVECDQWDEASIDSQIDVAADGWSLTLFNARADYLPDVIKGGATIELFDNDDRLLTGIVDTIQHSVRRNGMAICISGRDLAGQLVDCSVPIKTARQVTLGQLLQDFILKDSLGTVIHNITIADDSWLKNKVTVEPGESLWDAIAKAAAVTSQYVWFNPRGDLRIGNPFEEKQTVQTMLTLLQSGVGNNILSFDYEENVAGIFNEIRILGQDQDAHPVTASRDAATPYNFKRLKIITSGEVEAQADAQTLLDKVIHDNDLEAYTLTVTVPGWSATNNEVWQPGWEVFIDTDMNGRANARWVVMGRTLKLSRSDGKTTVLKLKRKGDWVQPLLYKEPKKKKTAADLGLDEDGRGTYEGDAQ